MKAGIRITLRGTGRKLQLAYAKRRQQAHYQPGHEPLLQTHCHGGSPGPVFMERKLRSVGFPGTHWILVRTRHIIPGLPV